MTSMSDRSRVLNETLSNKLYSTRRETDFISCGNKISLVRHAARAAPNYQLSPHTATWAPECYMSELTPES